MSQFIVQLVGAGISLDVVLPAKALHQDRDSLLIAHLHSGDATKVVLRPGTSEPPLRVVSTFGAFEFPVGLELRVDGRPDAPTGPMELGLPGSQDLLLAFRMMLPVSAAPSQSQLFTPQMRSTTSGSVGSTAGKVQWWEATYSLTSTGEIEPGDAWRQRIYFLPVPEFDGIVVLQVMTSKPRAAQAFAAADLVARTYAPPE